MSRLYNHHSEKLLAVAFLALWYFPPQPDFDLDKFNQVQKEKLGYETFGYWSVIACFVLGAYKPMIH